MFHTFREKYRKHKQGGGGRLPFHVPLGVTSVSRKFRFTFQMFRFTFQKVPFRESSVFRWQEFRFAKVPFYVPESSFLRKFRFPFRR